MHKLFLVPLIAALLAVGTAEQAKAGSLWSEAIKATGRLFGGKTLQTGVKGGATAAAKTAASKASREAAELAARKSAASAAKFFGDDALRASAKLAGGKAATFADDFAKVSSKLSAQNQRRLMMLAPDLQKTGQTTKALGLFSKGGSADDVMEMLWRHKGKIAAGAAVTGLVVHGDSIAEAGAEHIAKPFAEVAAFEIVKPMAGPLGVMMLIAAFATMFAVPAVGYLLYRKYWPKSPQPVKVGMPLAEPSLN